MSMDMPPSRSLLQDTVEDVRAVRKAVAFEDPLEAGTRVQVASSVSLGCRTVVKGPEGDSFWNNSILESVVPQVLQVLFAQWILRLSDTDRGA